MKNMEGFTLIELLLTVSIISFLSTSSIVSTNHIREKARDARRISDLKQIEKALELYYDDHHKYPAIEAAQTSSAADGCGPGHSWCNLENILSPYISKLPRDPIGLSDYYKYFYDSNAGDNNQTYGMLCILESSSNFNLVTGDGGFYNFTVPPAVGVAYELGAQPAYCKRKYNNTWLGHPAENLTSVCFSGN